MNNSSVVIFISHSRSDSGFVDRLEANLQARGLRTRVGRRKLDEPEKTIERSQVVLASSLPRRCNPGTCVYVQRLDRPVIFLEYQGCQSI